MSRSAVSTGKAPERGLTRRLSRSVRARDVGDTDRAQAERYVRDWLGSYVAGRAAPTGRLLTDYGRRAADLESRVFLASALSHVTETDDLHRASVTHPGCVVIPVALLLGYARGLRGHAILRAVLVGYEVMTRVGEALGPAHYRIFHNTATAGVFGSAAAAASLLDLDEDRWTWSLGNAGTQAAGLWQFNEEGAMSKPLHAGHAATAGLRAALLAAEGFTGPEAILEGDKGFFHALCPDADPGAVVVEGSEWKLPETSMKPYPCCRHVHPAIDASLEVRDELDGATPARVRVRSYPAALGVTDRADPTTPDQARFSIQYAVATTLLRGRPGLGAFEPAAMEESDVRELLNRIHVDSDPALAEAYPERWGAEVEVETDSGDVHTARRASAQGDPECPLDDQQLDAKVEGLMRWAGMASEQVAAALVSVRKLVADGSVAGLASILEGDADG